MRKAGVLAAFLAAALFSSTALAAGVDAELAVVGSTATSVDVRVTQTSGQDAVFTIINHCVKTDGSTIDWFATHRVSGAIVTFPTDGLASCVATVQRAKPSNDFLDLFTLGPVLDQVVTL